MLTVESGHAIRNRPSPYAYPLTRLQDRLIQNIHEMDRLRELIERNRHIPGAKTADRIKRLRDLREKIVPALERVISEREARTETPSLAWSAE